VKLVLILLLCACPLFADTPVFDNNSTGNGTDDFSFSHTNNCTVNCGMVVVTCTSTGGGTSVSSVTYNSVAMTELGGVGGVFQVGVRTQLWQLNSPTSGTNSVAVAVTNSNEASAAAITYSNVNQSTAVGTPTTGGGSGSAPSIAVTSAVGEVVVDGVCSTDNVTFTAGAGQTKRAGLAVNNVSNGASEEAGAASVTMSWTNSVTDWAAIGVSLKPSAAPPVGGSGAAPRMAERLYQ